MSVKLPRGFRANSNRIAIRVREKLGLSATSAIDPRKVCEAFDIALIPLSALPVDSTEFRTVNQSAFSALAFDAGIQKVIVFNDCHHMYRVNSDICHELAHCFLGHPSLQLLAADGDRSHVKRLEEEATCLSGYLLMTNEACHQVVQTGRIAEAMTIYGVSQPMLDFRLRKSGAHIIQQRRQR